MKPVLAACILGAASLALGQTTVPLRNESVTATQQHLKVLSDKFREIGEAAQRQLDAANCRVGCSAELSDRVGHEMVAARNVVTSQIHAEVDAFIVRTVDTRHTDLDRSVVTQGLRGVLPTTGDGPCSAFLVNSPKHRSLVVAYDLYRYSNAVPDSTSVTLRAYNETPRGIELADETGEDMNGFGSVTVTELHSPVMGQLFLLLSGYATGANGPNNRMRIYAYDGEKFRPIWMPENVWGQFNIRVTDNGFTVEGDYYREDRKRSDGYYVDAGGVTSVPPK
jgi:hypothetical protein